MDAFADESVALSAIFDSDFEPIGPAAFSLVLKPFTSTPCHVMIRLVVTYAEGYPDVAPIIATNALLGLSDKQMEEAQAMTRRVAQGEHCLRKSWFTVQYPPHPLTVLLLPCSCFSCTLPPRPCCTPSAFPPFLAAVTRRVAIAATNASNARNASVCCRRTWVRLSCLL
jgi:hypothetical protein